MVRSCNLCDSQPETPTSVDRCHPATHGHGHPHHPSAGNSVLEAGGACLSRQRANGGRRCDFAPGPLAAGAERARAHARSTRARQSMRLRDSGLHRVRIKANIHKRASTLVCASFAYHRDSAAFLRASQSISDCQDGFRIRPSVPETEDGSVLSMFCGTHQRPVRLGAVWDRARCLRRSYALSRRL